MWNIDTARLARSHNDANVAAIGSRQHTPEGAVELIEAFLRERFSGDPRHIRRLAQISKYEQIGELA